MSRQCCTNLEKLKAELNLFRWRRAVCSCRAAVAAPAIVLCIDCWLPRNNVHSGHSGGPGTCGSVGWNQDKSGKKGSIWTVLDPPYRLSPPWIKVILIQSRMIMAEITLFTWGKITFSVRYEEKVLILDATEHKEKGLILIWSYKKTIEIGLTTDN